jgi:glucose-6-phosphate dehydrogenase assembly protein OpcA
VTGKAGTSQTFWAEQATTPSAVEEALRALLRERHARDHSFAPARVLNMVVVCEQDWRGEVANRLESVVHHNPSRTILCAVEPGRKTMDAWVAVAAPERADGANIALGHEHVELDIGPGHLAHLDTIVDPLVVSDLATVVWAPHGHDEALEALRTLGQVALVDSVEEASVDEAVAKARRLSESYYVVDLAWVRTAPWRERIAMTFDPPAMRPELGKISGVGVRHHPDSAAAGLLFVAWLASRLGWRPNSLIRRDESLHGRARGTRQDVTIDLVPDPQLAAIGLAGVTVDTASGLSLALNRGPGGLHAVRTTRKGGTSTWVVMGASRGESGILGKSIREALLRDKTYRPALDLAARMLG